MSLFISIWNDGKNVINRGTGPEIVLVSLQLGSPLNMYDLAIFILIYDSIISIAL